MIATKIKLALLAGSLIAAAGGGWVTRDAFCDSAKAKADLANERLAHAATKIDLAAARMTADFGRAAQNDIEERAKAREERIRELEKHVATQPAAGRCRIDGAFRRRLLNIYPH